MNDFDKLGGLAPQDLRTRCYSDACWAGGHDGCGWGTCDCPCHHPDRQPLCAPTCMAYGSVGWWWDCPRHGHAGPFDSFEDAAAHHARAGGGG